MSRFIELTTTSSHKVLINVDRILDVYCDDAGQAIITLAPNGDYDYSYTVANYKKVVETIKGVTEKSA